MVSSSFLLLSVPALYCYSHYGHLDFTYNILLMMTGGFFVNGPYALITTAVSADLGKCRPPAAAPLALLTIGPTSLAGTHESLRGSASALATVTAIIDGFGSLGAALGPMLTGYISSMQGGFDNVFNMLYVAAICASLLIARLVVREIQQVRSRLNTGRDVQDGRTNDSQLVRSADV